MSQPSQEPQPCRSRTRLQPVIRNRHGSRTSLESHLVKLRRPKSPQSTKWAFVIFLGFNLLAAAFAPIQDCDEVFNYWEPTHYLNHRYGLQTWEYAPEFAIRSWLYIVIHAVIAKMGSLVSTNKSYEFYLVRSVLALWCAAAQTRLFATISKILNPRVALIYMLAMICSPGMFHASVAYLPSSFSMCAAMFGVAAFLDWSGKLKSAEGIMWFGIGSLIGWPFSAALIVPLIAEDLFLTTSMGINSEAISRYIEGIVRALIILAFQVGIDLFFYHKLVVVPWRIVAYNVFGGSDRGPDIFGTEPWDFYIRNLGLNFNIWFIFAVLAAPFLILDFWIRSRSTTRQSSIRSALFITPFYIWLAIFSAQAHKEERFMYPAYPFLCLNAAVSVHVLLSYVGSSDRTIFVGRIPGRIKLACVISSAILAIGIGALRILGIVSAYRAPLEVYSSLRRPAFLQAEHTVCLGKEWYRFPSSYFLPENMRARFVKSAFDGLLPGQFNEAGVGFGLFPGTWLEPSGMNDRNIEDPGKYIDIDHCSFLVDSYFPEVQASLFEPHHVLDTKKWEEVQCERFLDASHTHLLGRILWIPDLNIIPSKFRKKWGRYCLLRRRNKS